MGRAISLASFLPSFLRSSWPNEFCHLARSPLSSVSIEVDRSIVFLVLATTASSISHLSSSSKAAPYFRPLLGLNPILHPTNHTCTIVSETDTRSLLCFVTSSFACSSLLR